MTDALATVEQQHALAPSVPESKYALVRDTYAKGATPQEFELFVSVCNRLRLDPFARQIYAVKRWNSDLRREEMTPQVSIDGMRLTAERSGKYLGQSAPEWCGADGVWKDVWLSAEPPMAARVGVHRRNFATPIVAVALYSEYVQTKKDGAPTKFWKTMPANQLAKCAESLALRKAFPNELSGVYSDAEMGQADAERPQVNAEAKPKNAPKQEERKSSPPPAAAAGPAFAASFPDANYTGKPLSMAPIEILEDYRVWLTALLKDESRQRLHKKAQQSLDEAVAEVERRIEQQSKPDAIADAMQKQIDNRETDNKFDDEGSYLDATS